MCSLFIEGKENDRSFIQVLKLFMAFFSFKKRKLTGTSAPYSGGSLVGLTLLQNCLCFSEYSGDVESLDLFVKNKILHMILQSAKKKSSKKKGGVLKNKIKNTKKVVFNPPLQWEFSRTSGVSCFRVDCIRKNGVGC